MQTKLFDTLYDTDRMGRIRIYSIKVEETPTGAIIFVEHGLETGSKQIETIRVTEGKNLGKSNETTPFEQAIADAQSKWNLKQDKGYSTVKGKAPTVQLPMLAQKFQERSHYIHYPCYVQPKLNGMRCLAFRNGDTIRLQSRGGKPIQSIPHIESELRIMMKDGEIFDGELYTHGKLLQDILSAVKNIDHPSKSAFPLNQLEYWVYDRPANKSFTDRFMIEGIKPTDLNAINGSVLFVATIEINTPEEINELLKTFMEQGFEGIIIRNKDGVYAWNERSNDLQKLKLMQDAEFEIVGVKEGIGRSAGAGCFQCITSTGKSFDCNPEGSMELKREYLTNASKYIGKKLTVRFQEYSKDGIPVFPVGVAVRDYE